MLPSIKKQIRDQAWSLMEAYTPITDVVRVADRQRTNTPAGYAKAKLGANTPDALPLIRVDMPRTVSSGFTKFGTFSDEDGDTAEISGEVTWQCNLQVTAFGDPKKVDEQDQLLDNIQCAFLRAGQKFGIATVTNVGTMTTQQNELNDKGVPKLKGILTVPLTVTLDYQQFLTASNP